MASGARDKPAARRPGRDGRLCAREMVDRGRRAAFAGPEGGGNPLEGGNAAALRRALALPGAGVVGVRRGALVTLGRGVRHAGGTGSGRSRDPVPWTTRPGLVPWAGPPAGGRRPGA